MYAHIHGGVEGNRPHQVVIVIVAVFVFLYTHTLGVYVKCVCVCFHIGCLCTRYACTDSPVDVCITVTIYIAA